MQVKLLGFKLSTEEKNDFINLSKLFSYIESNSQEKEIYEHKRQIFINSSDNIFYHGLIITIKDQKKFCELKSDDNENFKIQVKDIDELSKIMDFNFFIVNKNTGIGIYQYYHQSFSLNSFGYFLKSIYRNMRDIKIENELNELGKSKPVISQDEKRKIKKKFNNPLNFEILIKKENLESLIKELDVINSFEFNYTYLTAHESSFMPLKSQIKLERTKILFNKKNQSKSLIAKTIVSIVKDAVTTKQKITGIDENKLEKILYISNNPDNFGIYEYDDIASGLNSVEIKKFHESMVVKILTDAANNFQHIFYEDEIETWYEKN